MDKKGAALILVFVILIGLSGVLFAFLATVSNEMKSASATLRNTQAFYIAEAGLAKARWALTTGEEDVGWGETNNDPFGTGEGTYIVTTEYSDSPTNEHVTIASEGYFPSSADYVARRAVVESAIPVSFGGTNLSLAATASASSSQGGNTPDKATDGQSNTRWRSNVSNGSWLKLDFGSATTFDKIVVSGTKIDSYAIEYSDNDSSYNAVTSLVEDPAWTFTFDSVEARYLRFSVSGNRPEINELETYNTAAPAGLEKGEFSTSW